MSRSARARRSGILGANGAGKTTLIESIMGARTLDKGGIEVCGLSPVRQRAECARHVSLQPQGSSLFRHLTVLESVELWASFYPGPRPADEVIAMVGLDDKRRALVRTLSGGQLQRLRLALALVGDTEVVAFDEPTVGLDPLARERTWDVIRQRAGRGAVLMATQMMDEAEALCERIVILDAGRVIAEGTVGELLDGYAGQGSLSFTTPVLASPAVLQELPGVLWASARRVGETTSVRLVSADVTRTRAAVLGSQSVRAERIRTAGPSLADVFLRLVGGEPADPALGETR
ncbi:ABC transporter ATP-binding protein [Propionibacterium australiense]|uniref:ABC transporter ATP-binding protein n=1 Tax=Propionibacterium australiense TaxID=119981 RepID=A0A8B3FN08_9ACTN|nr:ABC transporter ATP-binding protein [Propionibacterium australiense]RLP11138.1 ABC transporter ATP-binding protein [Propionibacterium australiense]